MSNNPLEAVTQAVNSLVTALKLPDESAKANEVLGEMSFPQFSRAHQTAARYSVVYPSDVQSAGW
ncbi:hypothetical protein EA221_24685 [Escherichia coli]|nr:hypothetical protein EA221_24685 [Escherichia coli]